MSIPSNHRTLIITLVAVALVFTTACSCSDLFTRAPRERPGPPGDKPSLTPTATSERPLTEQDATIAPSPTPTATLLLPTRQPTLAQSTSEQSKGLAFPNEPDTPFALSVTEDELNSYVAGRTFEQQGITVEDLEIQLTSREIIASFGAQEAKSGIELGLTVNCLPSVHHGQAYVQVTSFELDRSIGGFARLIAKAMIEQAIKDYSGEYGIPVPVEHVELEDIQLQDGAIMIKGRTKK